LKVRYRLGVLADDLTGAADTGVQFAEHGFSTLVRLELPSEVPQEEPGEVLVINTDSRRGTPAAARDSTVTAIRELERAGCHYFFLKIDSSLRGHVGDYVWAALTALPGRLALVAPAYPQQGRTTRGGTQFVHGVPVSESAAGTDNVSPARESHLPTLLRASGVATTQAEQEGWLQQLQELPGGAALVIDAADDAALVHAARLALRQLERYVFVGTAGLARALATELAGGAVFSSDHGLAEPHAARASESGAVLTVSGSTKEVSRNQVATAEGAGAKVVRFTTERLLSPGGSTAMAAEASHHLQQAKHVILTVTDPQAAAAPTVMGANLGAEIASALGEAAATTVRESGVRKLVLNGGDTALAVCKQLGIEGLWLRGEALPGVPYASSVADADPVVQLLTKSGGFGSDETLHQAYEWLTVREDEEVPSFRNSQ
jgi:uncharacterized protein YgbK (DUF1537 family)